MSSIVRRLPEVRRYISQDSTLSLLEQWFSAAGRLGVEDLAVAAGHPTADGDAVVTSILHPDAERTAGWYEQRDGVAWDQLYQFGFEHGLYYLLQLHTHPLGYSTQHSPRDDAGAFSDRLGFLSIVLPDFSLYGIDLHAERVSIHERTARGWRLWPQEEARERLVIVPAWLDLQRDKTGAKR
jgi:hypothetical protein